MSTARDYLAAVQQRYGQTASRHVVARADEVEPMVAKLAAATEDVPRLVAALTAALDVVDRIDAIDDELAHRPTIVRHLRAAITDALTPKENDS